MCQAEQLGSKEEVFWQECSPLFPGTLGKPCCTTLSRTCSHTRSRAAAREVQRFTLTGQNGWRERHKGRQDLLRQQLKEDDNSSSLKLSQNVYYSPVLHTAKLFDVCSAQTWKSCWASSCKVNPAWFPAWPKPMLNPDMFETWAIKCHKQGPLGFKCKHRESFYDKIVQQDVLVSLSIQSWLC